MPTVTSPPCRRTSPAPADAGATKSSRHSRLTARRKLGAEMRGGDISRRPHARCPLASSTTNSPHLRLAQRPSRRSTGTTTARAICSRFPLLIQPLEGCVPELLPGKTTVVGPVSRMLRPRSKRPERRTEHPRACHNGSAIDDGASRVWSASADRPVHRVRSGETTVTLATPPEPVRAVAGVAVEMLRRVPLFAEARALTYRPPSRPRAISATTTPCAAQARTGARVFRDREALHG